MIEKILYIDKQTAVDPENPVIPIEVFQAIDANEIKDKFNALIDYIYLDGLKEVGDLVLVGNNLTVTAPIKWRINSANYEKLTDSVFIITNATTGYNRIDLVYAKADNTLAIIEGIETMGVAVEPTLPVDTIRVAPVYITGSDIAPPLPDLTNYYTKSQVDALFVLNTLTFEDGVKKVGTTVSADSSVVRLNPIVAQNGEIDLNGNIKATSFTLSTLPTEDLTGAQIITRNPTTGGFEYINGTGFANNFILNQNVYDQTANFRIGGNGKIGGVLTVTNEVIANQYYTSTGNFIGNRLFQSGSNDDALAFAQYWGDKIIIRNAGSTYATELRFSNNIGSGKTILFPDASGTVALTSDITSAAVQKSGDTMTGDLILSSLIPTNALSATPKAYVDNAIAGLKFKLDVLVASTANVNIASAPSSLDGVTLTNGDRLLLKNQTNASQNGIYIFNGTGNALTRSLDADAGVELANKTIPVNSGTVNADTWFTVTNDTITLGTTNIVITQTAGAGTYSAGSNIAIAGNVIGVVNNPTFSGNVTAPNFNGLASNSSKWAGIPYVGNIAFPTTFIVGDTSNNGGYASLPQSRIALGIGNGSNLDNTVTGAKALDVINVNEVVIGKGLTSGVLYINYGGIPTGVTKYVFTNGANTGAKSDIQVKTLITDGYTVATLPTGVIGMRAYVTDALTPTYLGVVVGGGAIKCPVFYNGTNWIT